VQANVGDEIVVDGVHTGDLPRKGEILEILSAGDVTHYRVRWDDGREAVFYPGSTSHVVHLARTRGRRHA
jgi:hypothetical protein